MALDILGAGEWGGNAWLVCVGEVGRSSMKTLHSLLIGEWSGREDSNLRPSAPKADALPGCATPRRDVLIVTRTSLDSKRGVEACVSLSGESSTPASRLPALREWRRSAASRSPAAAGRPSPFECDGAGRPGAAAAIGSYAG